MGHLRGAARLTQAEPALPPPPDGGPLVTVSGRDLTPADWPRLAAEARKALE
jgi:hypothetical protein